MIIIICNVKIFAQYEKMDKAITQKYIHSSTSIYCVSNTNSIIWGITNFTRFYYK